MRQFILPCCSKPLLMPAVEATREAEHQMIAHLERHYGLSCNDAYMLCSVAVDLKLCEVVDAPHWVVGAFLPESIFAAE